jgi:hypothetical protein
MRTRKSACLLLPAYRQVAPLSGSPPDLCNCWNWRGEDVTLVFYIERGITCIHEQNTSVLILFQHSINGCITQKLCLTFVVWVGLLTSLIILARFDYLRVFNINGVNLDQARTALNTELLDLQHNWIQVRAEPCNSRNTVNKAVGDLELRKKIAGSQLLCCLNNHRCCDVARNAEITGVR